MKTSQFGILMGWLLMIYAKVSDTPFLSFAAIFMFALSAIFLVLELKNDIKGK